MTQYVFPKGNRGIVIIDATYSDDIQYIIHPERWFIVHLTVWFIVNC